MMKSTSKWYILQGTKVVPAGIIEACRFLERTDEKILKQTTLPNGKWVSTVFLGLDHRFRATKGTKPIVFESMVFPGKGTWTDEACVRYTSYAQALKGHDKLVRLWSKKTN